MLKDNNLKKSNYQPRTIKVTGNGGWQGYYASDVLGAKHTAKASVSKISEELEKRQQQLEAAIQTRGENDPYVIRLRGIVANLQATALNCAQNQQNHR